jgi:hypothetical protein
MLDGGPGWPLAGAEHRCAIRQRRLTNRSSWLRPVFRSVATQDQLAPEEAQRVFPRRGHQDLSEYVAALRDLHPGEAGAIERAGVSERALKRRLSLAAKQLGYRLTWGRQADAEMLYFQVIATPPTRASSGRRRRSAQVPTPAPTTTRAPESTAPQARRGRRHRAA